MSVKIYEKRVEVVEKDSRARIIYKVECPMPLAEQRKKACEGVTFDAGGEIC